MATYSTLDYLFDLTPSEKTNARNLTFAKSSTNTVGWDNTATVFGSESYALLHDTYRFVATSGATYHIASISFFDPFLLKIFDSEGNTIAANDESDDGPGFTISGVRHSADIIAGWVAPYSGTYYVQAAWNQGSYYKTYALFINEDIDTISAIDTMSPVAITFNPVDEAAGISVASNITVTFNEAIANGAGNIVLKTAAGLTIASFDAARSSNLSITGNTLTINPTSDLAYSTGYKVEFEAGSIKDLAGNAYAGTTSYNFTTVAAPDTTAPVATTFSPIDEAVGIAVASDIVVTFSEAIAKGTGTIVLKTAAGLTVATYDAAISTNLSISGNTLTINPTADFAYSTGYKVEFVAGSIKDLAGNAYAGTTSYNFTTVAAPEPDKILKGGGTNDSFTAGTGNDNIDGGAGIDAVTLSGNRSNHTLTKTADGWTVSSSSGGTDTLQNVERLKFSDVTVALDIDGNGGQAYRVYQAAFNRTPDSGGLGFWISTMDSGASLRSVAEGFVGSAEFKALYGTNPTNAQIVTKLYDNVLHRPGEAGGLNFWLGILDSKADTVAGVLAAFSESAENQAGLVGVIGNGFAYTPFA